MTPERLGVFDTPPDRKAIALALAITGLLFASAVAILPAVDVRLPAVGAFVPTMDAVMLVSDLIIGALLYAQAGVFRSRALTVLASGYVVTGLLLIPHALTFPGAFAPNGLLGAGLGTTAWLAMFRRFAFPTAVIVYALLKRADLAAPAVAGRPPARVLAGVGAAVALAALATLLATRGQELLPPFFSNSRDVIPLTLAATVAVTVVLAVSALVLLFRQDRSVLDIWLMVALASWVAQSLLNARVYARFTLGYYYLIGLMLAASLVVMLALIAESQRLYGRLALSTAAMQRERDARLTSIDAVAASIAHEIGQPLTAAALNASQGLKALGRDPPDVEAAIRALHGATDAVRRAFQVVRSVRAMFFKGSGPQTEFSLNELVRETALLLERDLAERRIVLELELDEALPRVRVNRVQLQQVLLNLMTNAIQAMAATRRRPRRLLIRSWPLEPDQVRLDIADTGTGIAPDELERIFEPFFTTRSGGAGLGLSLSRTIAEEHGGRLWATSGDGRGATFHLQLPASRQP